MEINTFYSIPLAFEDLIEGKFLRKCTLKESVYQHLYLLMVTHFGESRFDSQYGCELWDYDFSLMSQLKWKDLIQDSLISSIARYEKRIMDVKVKIDLEEYESMSKDSKYIKKRLGVGIDGILDQTNEPFSFYERVFISPMSIE